MAILPIINTAIGVLGLMLLGLYAWDTRKIRLAAQDQTEGQQKPCITLCATARDPADAIVEANGVVGAMVLATQEGNLALQNLGNGLALKVRYDFTQISPRGAEATYRRGSYLQHMAAGKSFPIPVPHARLRNTDCEFVATYESLGGRKYKSRIQVTNAVITEISFRRIKRGWFNNRR